jgi:hypothetical protein
LSIHAIDFIYGRHRNFAASPIPSADASFFGQRVEEQQLAEIEPTVETLGGLWSRSLIEWPDGRRDTTTWVNWLQGPSFYIDLRQPEGRPSFESVGKLRDIEPAHFHWLASQEGFAGELHHDGGYFEWRREIDFQPKAIYSDQGRLFMADGMMVEEGKDIPYIEHWHREPIEPAPVSALRLVDPEDGTRGAFMRVGSLFMYARARKVGVPEGRHLTECVAGAADIAAAQDLLDCEISQGAVTSVGWIVQRSSLPFREGKRIDPLLTRDGQLVLQDQAADGAPILRHWSIVDAQGSFDALPSVENVKLAR